MRFCTEMCVNISSNFEKIKANQVVVYTRETAIIFPREITNELIKFKLEKSFKFFFLLFYLSNFELNNFYQRDVNAKNDEIGIKWLKIKMQEVFLR